MKRPAPKTVRRAILLALIVLWEVIPATKVIPALFLPSLSSTLKVLIADWQTYGEALLVTLYEVAVAMVIACGGGIAAGALVGGLARLRDLLLPVFSSLYAVPIVILYPDLHRLVRRRFGIEDRLRRHLRLFPVMLSTAAGIRTIDPQFLLAARSMGATVTQLITRVIIPASIPTVFAGLRLGGALAIIGVVVSEMLTAAAGIGYLVTLNRTILESPRVFAAILMILVLAVAYDMLSRGASSGAWSSGNPPAARRAPPSGPPPACRRPQQPKPSAQYRSLHAVAVAPPADHRCRQLPAARLAGQSRDAVEGRAAHAHDGDLAHPRAAAGAGAGRRHHRRHPRHGARRHRHHHRWRDPPRKLLQPLRDRA